MQSTDNIDFIDYDKYDEIDLDYTRGNKKHSYYTDVKHYYFLCKGSTGPTQSLVTHVECLYRVTHGTFIPTEESDWDYLGYTDLVSWDVLSVENNEGDDVGPEKVLTPEQFLEYSQGLDEFQRCSYQ